MKNENQNENPKLRKLKHDFTDFAKYLRELRKAKSSSRHRNAQERSGIQTTQDTSKQ